MSSRVGQVFMGRHPEHAWFALVTSELALPRRKGSTIRGDEDMHASDRQVHTLVLWGRSGVYYPIERLEDTLASWELEGRRIA